jgi:hypothetical protein
MTRSCFTFYLPQVFLCLCCNQCSGAGCLAGTGTRMKFQLRLRAPYIKSKLMKMSRIKLITQIGFLSKYHENCLSHLVKTRCVNMCTSYCIAGTGSATLAAILRFKKFINKKGSNIYYIVKAEHNRTPWKFINESSMCIGHKISSNLSVRCIRSTSLNGGLLWYGTTAVPHTYGYVETATM